MRLSRLGAFHSTRLSFTRVLLRHLRRDNWTFSRPMFEIDSLGVGRALYCATIGERTYTLVSFSHDLPASLRSDRVIADSWDATFVLFDGVPTESDLSRLFDSVPSQEAGRLTSSELVMSRANRSVRVFDSVIEHLSRGEQPDIELLSSVGYLMRTTAVYGSGKFGLSDRSSWCDRPEFFGSFRPELLAVWLIRSFTIDLVEHLARVRGGEGAAKLDKKIARLLGIGNSTGLGMAPFLVNHPRLLHSWIDARETALSRISNLRISSPDSVRRFRDFATRALRHTEEWDCADDIQKPKIVRLREDLICLLDYNDFGCDYPWHNLLGWCESHLSLEGCEYVVSLLLECHSELVDDLADSMCADEDELYAIDGSISVSDFADTVESLYSWIHNSNFLDDSSHENVWYVSSEKKEPRLGFRSDGFGEWEQPLSPARDIHALTVSLNDYIPKNQKNQKKIESTLGDFLVEHPEHRHIVRRVLMLSPYAYSEIRDNLSDASLYPIDLLRCKLSFLGATKFDPRSDRWLRITLFAGSPFPDEISSLDPDDMVYPLWQG